MFLVTLATSKFLSTVLPGFPNKLKWNYGDKMETETLKHSLKAVVLDISKRRLNNIIPHKLEIEMLQEH